MTETPELLINCLTSSESPVHVRIVTNILSFFILHTISKHDYINKVMLGHVVNRDKSMYKGTDYGEKNNCDGMEIHIPSMIIHENSGNMIGLLVR